MKRLINYLFLVELCCFPVQCFEGMDVFGSCFITLEVMLVSDFYRKQGACDVFEKPRESTLMS